MTQSRKLVFAKNATNRYGPFKQGDKAPNRFPEALIDSYVAHGILVEAPEPIKPAKARAAKKATK